MGRRGSRYDERRAEYARALEDSGIDISRGVKLPHELPDLLPQSTEEQPIKSDDLTADRVQYLAQLLIRGLYKRTMVSTLSNKWGVSELRVKSLVAEADRYVRVYSAIDQDETRTELNVLGHKALQLALERGELMAAASLLRVIADVSLDKRAQKISVSHEVKEMSDEELERRRKYLLEQAVKELPREQLKELAEKVPDAEFVEVPEAPITTPVLESTEDNEDTQVPDSGNNDRGPNVLSH